MTKTARAPATTEKIALLVITGLILIASGIDPHDRGIWALEVAPVIIAVPILITTHKNFPLTTIVYRLIFIHALILLIGGHYTYARVPVGFWVQDLFDLSRNHYDRLGHLAQGFVPAILAREILLRRSPLVPGKWLFSLICCVCLAISATYEFIEWWDALIGGGAADQFLATQCDVWDTQCDMFMALIGAASAQILLGRAHDQAMKTII
ncbi:MAG: DUF2238 domain-containing protein [Alphaproteobacteria bacterium]